MSDLEAYQTDYLFLLVGTNPLPNYIAALLLAKDSGTIYLLHSRGNYGTEKIASRLSSKIKIRRPLIKDIYLCEIDEANSGHILQKMRDLLHRTPSTATVGLHYTGGTKAMAIHVYRAIAEARQKAVFSYLDARTLSLVIDGRSSPIKIFPEKMDCVLGLVELITLHGYTKPLTRKEPVQPDMSRVILEVVSKDEDSWTQWKRWIDKEENLQALPDILHYPLLEEIIKEFDKLCGQHATPDLVARCLGYNQLVSCSKWLQGVWLEEYALYAISKVAEKCNISDYSIDLNLQKHGADIFNLDIAAVKGYQLFALSCTLSQKKGEIKEHLLEVYVRARQIGGDEARIGLICCSSNPKALENEIDEAWFTEGRVKVFGRNHLLELPSHLENWFNTANGPQI